MEQKKLHFKRRNSYLSPSLVLYEVEVQAGFAVSYDPTDAIEKPGSDQDYEEW